MTEPKLLKKITIKEITGMGRDKTVDDVKRSRLEQAKNNTELAVIAGKVTGYGGKATQYGESLFLIGSFIAQNRMTGEVFKSGKCYLPKDATENLVAMFQGRTVNDQYIKFQLSVTVVEDSSATGYTYICQPTRTAESVTEEAEMLASIAALPAPKPQAKLASNKK